MARRINAPGIELNEIDRSKYDETVDNSTVGTATMVLGFGDKGDDYTVKWINTMNTFIKNYGTPTNEAEKYFYNSVSEIIDRGGVCYAAKLPYYNDSQDNFVYTSFQIDSSASYLSSADYIVRNEISTIFEGWSKFNANGQVQSDWNKTYRVGKSLFDVVLRPYSFLLTRTPNNNAQNPSNVYHANDYQPGTWWARHSLWGELAGNNDISDVAMDIPRRIVDFICDQSNFGYISERFFRDTLLSSNRLKRMAPKIVEKIIQEDYVELEKDWLFGCDIRGLDGLEDVRMALVNAFGDIATPDGDVSILSNFAKNLYLGDYLDAFTELSNADITYKNTAGTVGTYKLGTQFPNFQNGQLQLLKTKFTEIKNVDDTIHTYARIYSQDNPSSNELMSFEQYDKFLVKQLKAPLNKIYIVDITRGMYEKDNFGNQIVGIVPVIVSPANAMYVQGLIKNNDSTVKEYNALGKIRNSFRKKLDDIMDESRRPFNYENEELSSWEDNYSTNFVGLGEYLGQEKDVTYNDYTVSIKAAELFPAIKFVGGGLDRKYLNQIGIVVFKAYVDTANENRISFLPVESFVGSLDRYVKDIDNGRNIFIDDVVNSNSDYINVFSNANIPQEIDSNPLGLKNAQIFVTSDQTACSMGFYQRDMRKNIHVTKSIYEPMLKIFQKSEDKNTLDVDIIVDAGVSNIAQFIASTQMYERNETNNEPIKDGNHYVKDDFKRYGLYDYNIDTSYMFKLENQDHVKVWKKVIQRFDDFAKNTRKDLIFIADGPRPFCLEGDSKIIRPTKPENTVKKTILPKMKLISDVINSSYSAGYLNWFRSYERYSGEYMWMPPSIKALGVYLYTDNQGAYWDAPAGLNRGRISNTLDVAFNPTNEEAGQIYINSWNYAVSFPLDGIILEGQKTFQRDKTALDRVNVRRLMLGLEKNIREICKYFVYEGNTEYLRTRLTDQIEQYLSQVKVNDGISQYIVVCDERNNNEQTIENNELHITIAVRPIKTIEFIVLNFIATNQSVDVQEVIEQELGA